MAKKLIKETVVLYRDGKRITPTIGKTFDLTDDEIKSINSVRPQAISDVEKVEEDPQSAAHDAAGKQAAAKGAAGKKTGAEGL
ncbi:hypothetical protein AH2_00061 [Burkholderia phage vB_BceS_AH2]|uniref:DUF7443 domain-containing protein n=1 Tax=Burkholderia phage vB_BceS_AH2 TaxID=1133022 RepID=I6NSS7_9CAUD|nr:hypothetical protein B613_gp61 [Burkholderia phage vB_BceS_AH2]AEY69571.1 hypothetical protein AH2_00061 [Burkholderia phage vB_BceS_AH2]